MRVTGRSSRSRRAGRWEVVVLLLPALAWLGLLFLLPIGRLFYTSLFGPGLTLRHYAKLITEPAYFKILVNTFEIGLVVTMLALLLGYPVAFLLATARPRTAGLMLACIMLPLWTSVLVRTYAWMVLLGRRGVVNEALTGLGLMDTPVPLLYNRMGVTIGMVHVLLPFMILPLYSVMKGIDVELLKAAQNLGANVRQAFLQVYLPLSLPGIAAGCLLVFVTAIGFFITPALLGGRGDMMISMLIETQVRELLNWEFASALSVTLLALTAVILAVYQRWLGLDRLWGGTV